MTVLHKAMTKEDVEKFQWCAKISDHLVSNGWEFEDAYELAEVLHYDNVELTRKYCDPIEVLEEEMTYWGD